VIDFRPSPSQQLLVAAAREYLRRQCPIELAQALALDARGVSDKLWRGMAELGWAGLLLPSDLGGSDGSLLDAILLVEELGYAAVPGPYVTSAVVASTLLLASANEAQRTHLLGPMATGDRIATVALVEEPGTFDLDAVALGCDRGRLTGRKLFVKDAHIADALLVVVRAGADLEVLVVPTERPGIARVPLDTMSGEKLFAVTFDDVEVHAENRLAAGRPAIAAALDAGALARTAEMVGAAQRILELTVEHAKTRVQGGRPIGAHQAIQHACADLVRDVDCARGLLRVAAWKLTAMGGQGSDGRGTSADVAMAKAYAGEACLAVARRGHQIFGAISYCEEHPMHLFHKRIQAASIDFGDAALHLETVARAIGLASGGVGSSPCGARSR
jgi:alkylation response protein AidB-like acyl-CoA dehydrogenase